MHFESIKMLPPSLTLFLEQFFSSFFSKTELKIKKRIINNVNFGLYGSVSVLHYSALRSAFLIHSEWN